MVQMFLLNCLPPPICVLKHVHTRLIILTGGKNNHKIKIAETGQLAVASRHSPLGLQIYLFIISEILSTLTTCKGRQGGGGGGVVKRRVRE